MSNILKFKNKPQWKHLDRVGEKTAVIISDAQNFSKFFVSFEFTKEEMKKIRNERYPELKDSDLLEVVSDGIVSGDDHFEKEGSIEGCIRNKDYTGYQVPLEFSDVAVSVLGREIDKPKSISSQNEKVLTHIFIFWGYLQPEDCIDLINKGYELKKTNVCNIDIYSKRIGIGIDNGPYGRKDFPLPGAEFICDCYLGNGPYDISQIDFEKRIIPQNKDALELDKKNIGTLVELNPKDKFTVDDIIEILEKINAKGY